VDAGRELIDAGGGRETATPDLHRVETATNEDAESSARAAIEAALSRSAMVCTPATARG